jgi:hypothetical protein
MLLVLPVSRVPCESFISSTYALQIEHERPRTVAIGNGHHQGRNDLVAMYFP